MNTIKALVLLVLLFFTTSAVFAQRHFFGFDIDEEGWTFLANDQVVWDGTLGLPPGSLRVTGSIALSPCLEATPGGDWHVQADVFSAGAQGCVLTVESYRFPDCSTGGATGAVVEDQTVIDDEWVNLSFDFPLALIDPYFQIELSPRGRTGPCYFDNVEAIGPPPVSSIPTLGVYGQILLALALLGSSIAVFRRIQG